MYVFRFLGRGAVKRNSMRRFAVRRLATNGGVPMSKSTKDTLFSPVKVCRVKLRESEDKSPSPPILEDVTTSKYELISKYGFDLRELRIIDPHKAKSQTESDRTDALIGRKYATPEFFIRDNAFISHLGEPLSALISPTECLLLNKPSAGVKDKFLAKLNATLNEYRQMYTAAEKEKYTDSDSDLIMDNGKNAITDIGSKSEIPFEFHCLEAVCKAVAFDRREKLAKMRDRVALLIEANDASANDGNGVLNTEMTNELRQLKTELAMCVSDTKSLVTEFQILLNTPKDISQMCLTTLSNANADDDTDTGVVTSKSHTTAALHRGTVVVDSELTNGSAEIGDHYVDTVIGTAVDSVSKANAMTNETLGEIEDLELLLENYLWQFEEVLHGFELLLADAQMHERTLEFILDKTRNEIMKAQLRLSVLTCGFSYGALCAGIFGMNLTSHIEADPVAFYVAAGAFSALLPFGIYNYFRHTLYIRSKVKF